MKSPMNFNQIDEFCDQNSFHWSTEFQTQTNSLFVQVPDQITDGSKEKFDSFSLKLVQIELNRTFFIQDSSIFSISLIKLYVVDMWSFTSIKRDQIEVFWSNCLCFSVFNFCLRKILYLRRFKIKFSWFIRSIKRINDRFHFSFRTERFVKNRFSPTGFFAAQKVRFLFSLFQN